MLAFSRRSLSMGVAFVGVSLPRDMRSLPGARAWGAAARPSTATARSGDSTARARRAAPAHPPAHARQRRNAQVAVRW